MNILLLCEALAQKVVEQMESSGTPSASASFRFAPALLSQLFPGKQVRNGWSDGLNA